MYLKRIIDCVIKWCKILDDLVINIVAITTWLITTITSVKTIIIVTIQPVIVKIPIASSTTTSNRNSIITSDDKYRNITIGNLVNRNNNKITSTQSSMTTLEDSFVKTTIVELIKIPNDETIIAPIKTYTIILSIISVDGYFASTKLWSDLINAIEWNYVTRVHN